MTQKEQLIELLLQAETEADKQGFCNCFVSRPKAECIADHLLENNVIVPPCKVGDMVYVLEPCSCRCGYRTFEECHRRRTNATKWIKAVMVANKHHNRCMKLFVRPYKPEYIFKIGKTVFLNKEEAEVKLKECDGK